MECGVCNGTGDVPEGICPECDGSGWVCQMCGDPCRCGDDLCEACEDWDGAGWVCPMCGDPCGYGDDLCEDCQTISRKAVSDG